MKRSILALGWLIFLSVSGWAGTQTPNGFLYKPDVGARGTAEKNLYDAGLDRVDTRLGKEIWVGDPNYGSTLQEAVAAVGGIQAILRVPAKTHNINADLSIPANIALKVERGATLSVATGKTLTINGPVEAGDYQIFSWTGTGAILLSGIRPSRVPGSGTRRRQSTRRLWRHQSLPAAAAMLRYPVRSLCQGSLSPWKFL